jgi:D-amino peptidase
MMEGLDATFDAVFFIGYHGAVDGPASVLSHTYNPAAVQGATINGVLAGESGINALVSSHYGVPVVLVSGDQHTAAQAEPFCPGAEMAVVKRSVTRFAAQSLTPEAAHQRIKDGASSALKRLSGITPASFAEACSLRLRLRNADLAELATGVRDVRRESDLEVLVEGGNLLTVYRNFVAVLQITRVLAQEH